MDWLYFFVFILGCIIGLLIYGSRKQQHFTKYGIKYIKPIIPIVGSNFVVLSGIEHVTTYLKRIYNTYPDQRYIGIYESLQPAILMRDPELLKMIAMKHFDNFPDHRLISPGKDDIFVKTLLGLKGDKWRDMRATLSPAFSSSKMKNMFGYIEKCAKNMSQFYVKELERSVAGKTMIEIDVKDSLSKYLIDAIASSAFGIETNTLIDDKNEFYRVSKDISESSIGRLINFFIIVTIPPIAQLLNLTFFGKEYSSFFSNLVKKSIKAREENNIVRHDMIHLLMQAKKGTLVHEKTSDDVADTGFSTVEESDVGKQTTKTKWEDDILEAQAFIFFVGGFDTTNTMLSFFFYEMARDPDVQKKLHNEIDEHRKHFGNDVSYNDLKKLKYLDMCVSEILRMYPSIPAVDRLCNKDFVLPSPDGDDNKTYLIRKGEVILFPIYAIHYNPEYYPEPEKFNPERFSDEATINPTTFLPFGIGPRNCIGSRYALMVAKSLIFHMLSNFEVVVTEKTEIPVKLAYIPFGIKAKNGIYIGLKKRVNN